MSIHIEAKKGEIAETVLLPGDPLRAKWIAETFLEDSVCYNDIRGMLGYTGTYKGRRVSVQGTGMGIPSAMIYCHELIKEYGVKTLIRVGSAGAFQPDLKLMDIVIAMSASTNSSANRDIFNGADYAPTANFDLLMKAVEYAQENQIDFTAGNVLSSDIFYDDDPDYYKKWAKYGVLCAEMETAGIYTLAAKFGVKALSILTISDSLVNGEEVSSEIREKKLSEMVKIALNTF
ncbi:purine-nucleoside phosphorylase [Christiangramia gaetbulicola]|uniref:Uridine phosphorylase n=1 Tax=Christiangramia gaetbulicola TaxID=703340 RepID=A0A2T6ACV8_9FLAO|nr:purine-nucleoside phosphorylase [Christiangramia gaetbulicola]PTX41638.1 purine-nucleoside phosphorylase [Christiangramia gaetbulicola]